jgi:hypothetical protein
MESKAVKKMIVKTSEKVEIEVRTSLAPDEGGDDGHQ